MRVVIPGRPQSKLQAVATACWEGKQVIAYITGNAFVVLDAPNNVLQTTYLDEPHDLVAIVIDELSGKIAIATRSLVHVYQPDGYHQGSPRWSPQRMLPAAQDDIVRTLSWGLDEELLVGSNHLNLFSMHNEAEHLWSKPLSSPAKIALLSYDTSLIATTGQYDRLVKLWRRLSLADQRFEHDYLPHPTMVTGFHWRRPFHREQSFDNVLYTFCGDNKLRIWTPDDVHSTSILRLWAVVDLMEAIQPRSLETRDRSLYRFAFVIHSRDFTIATERAVQQATKDEHEQMALHHLIEVANRSPEVCVVLDDRGNMSAWGLESIGSKHRQPGDIFNIAHGEGLKIRFDNQCIPEEHNVQFLPFTSNDKTRPFSLLVHHFDGQLEWLEGRLDQFFSPLAQADRLPLKCCWTGHSATIKNVHRSVTGRSIVSRTGQNEIIVWKQHDSSPRGETIRRSCVVPTPRHVHRAWLLQDGKFVVFLHHDSISLWDARASRAREIMRKKYSIAGKPLCLVQVPEVAAVPGLIHVAMISSEMQGIAWEIMLPSATEDLRQTIPTLNEFDRFVLGTGEDLAFIYSVDPAGEEASISGFLDLFSRDIAISFTNSGKLTTWTARIDTEKQKMEWLATAHVETSIEWPHLASGTSIRKAALVSADQTQLTIWSTKAGTLELEQRFTGEHGLIQDLDWSSTPDKQSILAVGFPHKIIIFGQLRYDFLEKRPAWAALREIDTLAFTSHAVGDSVWLGGGNFIIGAGNQLFVIDATIERSEIQYSEIRLMGQHTDHLELFSVVERLNGPLPIYHPQYLAQFVLNGQMPLVQQILVKLWRLLKFYTEGDPWDKMLGFDLIDVAGKSQDRQGRNGKDMPSAYADLVEQEPDTITEDMATSLNELLTSRQIPLLSSKEQLMLADTIECVATVEKHRRAIDENGSRFLLFFRQHAIRINQQSEQDLNLSWRDITWAYHSSCQDILTDLVSRHYDNRMTWKNARESGIFMWMTDVAALRQQFEVIARNEYTKSDDRNPVECSLFYLALRKKAVLVGLWRMAIGGREQVATQKLLSNNFNEPRWKTAALKNAYALMGKRRFHYAAAFFLLADHLKDAVSVLSNQLDDLQLAIAVARVYEGEHGPVLREFLEDKVLVDATTDGNRWMTAWALWMLGKRDRAVRALVLPLSDILSPPESPRLLSKRYTTDDPSLIVLYTQLRAMSLQTLRGALSISPRTEWDFVTHTARLYSRMGCDVLALELVRDWEFLVPRPKQAMSPVLSPVTDTMNTVALQSPFLPSSPMLRSQVIDPRQLLRRRSSLVVDDLPQDLQPHNGGHATSIAEEQDINSSNTNGNGTSHDTQRKSLAPVKKPPPTQFHEPDANSLLDAFGF